MKNQNGKIASGNLGKRQVVDRSLHPVVGDPWVYEEEVWTASDWWLRHFNEEFWSIEGMIRTPSSGFTRPEVVGVASEMYAQGIVDAHNAAMREMRERIANTRITETGKG